MQRALGLDIGSKTIGVAMTDEAGIAAHPVSTLARAGHVADAAAIAQLIATHDIGTVAYGMPFELTGRIGHRGKQVQAFIAIARAAAPPQVEWVEEDERFTTKVAEQAMRDAGASRKSRLANIDTQAAVVILQGWLDRARGRGVR